MLALRVLLIVGLALAPISRLKAEPVLAPAAQRQSAVFEGIQPGVSTLDDVFQRLGAPREIVGNDGQGSYVFDVAPFKRVEVTLDRDRVGTIILHFQPPLPVADVVAQFKLNGIRPVTIPDEAGHPLGTAYPENGVLLGISSGDPETACEQVVLGRIHPQAFVLRAESTLKRSCGASLADLDAALSLDPAYGAAHWLRGQVLLDMGQIGQALTAVDEALRLEPRNCEFRLLRSRVLEESGDFQAAVEETRRALADCDHQPEVKGRALCQLGDQLAAGPERNYRSAIEQHQQAIQAVQGLINDRRAAVRRAAKQVLIDANLAVAQDIAWGPWNSKQTAVPKWIDRASQLAKEMIASEGVGQEVWFDVSRRALAAHVGLQGAVNPANWIEEASRSGRELITATQDPATRQQLEWALGMALYDALQIYLTMNQYDSAVQYGTLALSLLEGASSLRQDRPGHSYMMGRFYFRLGSIEVAQNNNHPAAAKWFKKAAPLLEQPIPNSALGDIGRQGESLVGIGVTLWQVQERDEALRLTERGLELMERAVEQGILRTSALNAPYSNLASMHQTLGNAKLANAYQRLASHPAAAKR